MSNPTWPGTLPQKPLIEGYQEAPGNAGLEFEVEEGPAKRRNRLSGSTRNLSFNLVLTTAQRATLLTFYEATLKKGALDFDWVHPIDGGSAVAWQWIEPPAFSAASHNRWAVQCRLLKKP